MAILDRAIVRMLPAVPRPVVEKLSARYIAGRTLDDALRCVLKANDAGKRATVDVLGEHVDRPEEAASMTRAYEEALAAIDRGRLDANISVKPTAVGLQIGYEEAQRNLEALLRDAAGRGNFVRIEMEESRWTDATLRLYREFGEAGYDNAGIVLQSALRRTLADARVLAPLRPNVRLVKGIYVEPESIAFTDYDAIRASYVRVLDELLGAGAYVGIATHDEWLVTEALELLVKHRARSDRYEFQMLLGVREGLGDELVREGHPLRIYVPYGEEWYAYSLRRLQENPKVAGYVAADTLNRLLLRRSNGR